MKQFVRLLAAVVACTTLTLPHLAAAQTASAIPPTLITPDKVETRIGPLQFKDGAPSVETAARVYDTLDFTRALDVFLNSYGGASAYAIRQGLLSIGAEDNTVTIYPELMDSKSLYLTANADTVYYFSIVDLTKGPMVVEQPPKGLGTVNDMWFGDGPLPEGGFYIARSKTTRVIYAARAFLTDNDPKPTVELIKKTMKIYPYTPGGLGTSIATGLEGKVRLEVNPPVPATKFVEASGKSYNTIPPSDFSFFEMINANVQQEPADSYNTELAGQLAAIGIVKGTPFKPDARMRKILTDAAAVGNAAGRSLNWRFSISHPDWAYYPGSMWGNMLWPSVSSQGAAPAVKIGTLEAVSTLVSDLRQVCDRQPVACAAASQAVVQLGQQARVGAQMLSDFLNEKFGTERTS
jgi:hypothetical protein